MYIVLIHDKDLNLKFLCKITKIVSFSGGNKLNANFVQKFD